MPPTRTRSALLIVAGSVLTLSAILGWVAWERRSHRLMMADYHGALQVEAQSRAESDRWAADLFEGRVDHPVRAFLNPGDPEKLRARAAVEADRASDRARLRADYLRAASRPWVSTSESPGS